MNLAYENLEKQLMELEEEQKALGKKLAFLEMVVENSVDIYWQTDLEGNFTFVSKAQESLYGYSREESQDMPLRKFFAEPDRVEGYKIWNEVLNSRQTKVFETNVLKKDNTFLPVEVRVWPLIQNGKIVGICGISRDISWRKKAEKELKDQKEKYQRIVENTSDVIWVWDLEKRQFVFISPSIEKLTGYKLEEIKNRSLKRNLSPEYKDIFKQFFSRTVEDYGIGLGNERFPEEERLEWKEYRPDGRELWAESTLSVIRDEAGKAVEILGVTRDITERKKLESDLAHRNAFIETILNHLPIGLAVNKISDGTISYVNDNFQRIYGWGIEDIGNVDGFFEKVFPDPEESAVMRQRIMGNIAGRDPSRMKWENFVITTKIGEKRIVTAHNIPLYEQDLMISTVQDVTEVRRLENQLHQARKMESIAALTGGITHQFNNALSIITGYLGMIRLESPGVEFVNNYVLPMEKSVRRMSGLTEQLLAYSRGGKYHPEKVAFNELVQGIIPGFEDSIPPFVFLKTDFSCEKTVTVEVDETQIKTAFYAILANAAEAIEKEGLITITCKRERFEGEPEKEPPSGMTGDYACLSVTDDGKGMDTKTRNRIFEPFFTTKFQGRGLGMAAAFGIIKNHGGWIDVQSEPGKGTTVSVYLPTIN
jgi:PAS domain S-box-containing protein